MKGLASFAPGQGSKRSAFFFVKKNQKTFIQRYKRSFHTVQALSDTTIFFGMSPRP
jgi:hypothetical protein